MQQCVFVCEGSLDIGLRQHASSAFRRCTGNAMLRACPNLSGLSCGSEARRGRRLLRRRLLHRPEQARERVLLHGVLPVLLWDVAWKRLVGDHVIRSYILAGQIRPITATFLMLAMPSPTRCPPV